MGQIEWLGSVEPDIKNSTNWLDEVGLSYLEVEWQLEQYPLKFGDPRAKRHDVEDRIPFPVFLESFQSFIRRERRLPTQSEFIAHYREINLQFFKRTSLTPEQDLALNDRMCRVYPSLARELHFALMLHGSTDFDLIFSNFILDTSRGIDVLLRRDMKYYGLKLMVGTQRSLQFCDVKDMERHTKLYNDVEYIRFPLVRSDCKQVGRFELYHEGYVETLLGHVVRSSVG